MNKFTLGIGLGTLVFFGAGGIYLIELVQERNFAEVLTEGWSLPMQLLAGAVAGAVSGGIALFLVTRPFFREERNYYYDMLSSRLELNVGSILFISLCAGIGEEIFFRGGLQPVAGLWFTSFIFVALHGYLNFTNWRISVYGLVMLLIIAGFGYMFRYAGLISVILAHSIYDIILFVHIYRSRQNAENGHAQVLRKSAEEY